MSFVQGAHQVLVVPPYRVVVQDLENNKDAVAFERMKVSLEPYTKDRVHVLSEISEVTGRL